MKKEVLNYPHYFLEGGGVCGELMRSIDWSETSLGAPESWPQAYKSAAKLMLDSPVSTNLFLGKEFVRVYNDAFIPMLGKTRHPLAMGKPALQTSQKHDMLESMLLKAASGETVLQKDLMLILDKNGYMETCYMDVCLIPLYTDDGSIGGVYGTIVETTSKVNTLFRLQKSEQEFKDMVIQAPIATCVFTGKEQKIEIANDLMIAYWGKDKDIIGKPLAEAVPEFHKQSFLHLLDDVYTSGKPFEAKAMPAEIVTDGQSGLFYFDFNYKAVYNPKGDIYGVMAMAVDVTEQILLRKKTEETCISLESAIELANLSNWTYHVKTQTLDYDARMRYWFGFDQNQVISLADVRERLNDEGRAMVAAAMTHALTPGTDGICDAEYKIKNFKTGWELILHARGKSFYDDKGEAYKVSGTVLDVTEQRRTEADLIQKVHERTEEISETNKILVKMNEELEDANRNLFRSNQELSQYAYVASHDLQEPLRKIRTFASVLKNKSHTDETDLIITKINISAERMSLLIGDLLEFSRLLNSEKILRTVDLNKIVNEVLSDFELLISEKQAEITVNSLPVVNAVALQMNQLFYNIISNALKFVEAHVKPVIVIDSAIIEGDLLKKYISKPQEDATYYVISIRDNGVGFEQKYAEQILEVFKRLYGKDVFPGSGIGLALCRRIVANHGGHLYAESEVGKGSVFNIILPVLN